jgi:hypothetical protein
MNVERGAHALAQLVLQLGQPLAEIADVVIVDQRQRADRVDALRDLRPPHGGPGEIAQQLGASAAALVGQLIQLRQQRAFDGDSETDQRVFHSPRRYHHSRSCSDR